MDGVVQNAQAQPNVQTQQPVQPGPGIPAQPVPAGYAQPAPVYPGQPGFSPPGYLSQPGLPQPTTPPAPPVPTANPVTVPNPGSEPPKPTAPPKSIGGYAVKDADPVVSAMLDTMGLAAPELDLERAFGTALQYGDPNLVDEAYIKEAVPKGASKITAIARQLVDTVNQRAEQLQNQVYALVGGEKQWGAAVDVFNKNAAPAIKKVVADMLDSRSPDQIMAGAQLVQQFSSQSGLAAQVKPSPFQGSVPTANSAPGMGYTEFKDQLNKLDRRAIGYEDQIAELMRQRAMGMQAGIR